MATPHLDGKHVVFGEVVQGKSIVRKIEALKTEKGDKPVREVVVVDCGQLSADEALASAAPRQPDALGDGYEEFPEDMVGESGPLSAERVLEIATDCKGFGNAAFKAGAFERALDKYSKALRYLNEDPDLDAAPAGTKDKLDKLRVDANSNAALMCLKLGRWPDAHDLATGALDVKGISDLDAAKALFRRGQAAIKMKDEDGAVEDLAKAHKLVPADANIAKELAAIKDVLKAKAAKEKKAYQKFFSE